MIQKVDLIWLCEGTKKSIQFDLDIRIVESDQVNLAFWIQKKLFFWKYTNCQN